jgi:hypothetical protein
VNCNFLCFNASKCVGFNFRAKTKAINCQLTNTTKKRKCKEEGEWTLYWDVDGDAVHIKLVETAFVFAFSQERARRQHFRKQSNLTFEHMGIYTV